MSGPQLATATATTATTTAATTATVTAAAAAAAAAAVVAFTWPVLLCKAERKRGPLASAVLCLAGAAL